MISKTDIDLFKENKVILLKNVIPADYIKAVLDIGLSIYPEHQSKRKQPKDFGSPQYWPIMDMYTTKNKTLFDFMTSDLMAEVTKSFLGDTVYLFNEQFVFKPAGDPYSVKWHTDNSCTSFHQEGLSGKFKAITCVWFLTDHDAESGGIKYLPKKTKAGIDQSDFPDELVEINAQPGDLAIWDGNAYHISGPNTSDRDRHLWLQVYSTMPLGTDRYHQLFIENGIKIT